MAIAYYLGTEGGTITVKKPEELWSILDYVQSRMMDHVNDNNDPDGKFDKAASLLSRMMKMAEDEGFADYEIY